jgi:acyl carrier protein
MDRDRILTNLKASIAKISGLPVDSITDSASYVEDLGLDSLTILEIVVEVDYEFKVKIPEDKMDQIRTVEDTVNIVLECMNVAVATQPA